MLSGVTCASVLAKRAGLLLMESVIIALYAAARILLILRQACAARISPFSIVAPSHGL